MTLRIVIADDQPVIRDGFAALLGAQPGIEVVGTASDGEELVALVRAAEPALALVDVRMPVMDGIAATRAIAASGVTKVLILTTFDLDEYVFDAIKAGASGFLLKDVTSERLVEAVRLVADGSMLLGPTVTTRLVSDFANRTRGRGREGDVAVLSPREREVLLELAKGRSNAEIAAALCVSQETVKSHVGEILRKLSLRDRIQAVVFSYENGIVEPGD